jgi:beta-glucuronidase
MLQSQDTITRETRRLDGIWSFTADASGVGRAQSWWRAARPSPASRRHQGDA